MSATTEWSSDFDEIRNIVWDVNTHYLIEIEFVDNENPARPVRRMFTVGTVEDGEFWYPEMHSGWMDDKKVVRYAEINE